MCDGRTLSGSQPGRPDRPAESLLRRQGRDRSPSSRSVTRQSSSRRVLASDLDDILGDPSRTACPPLLMPAYMGRAGQEGRARRRRYGAWSGAAVDEWGEAVEQALQAELEQVLQIEVVIGSGEALEDGEAARLHDCPHGRFLGVQPFFAVQ